MTDNTIVFPRTDNGNDPNDVRTDSDATEQIKKAVSDGLKKARLGEIHPFALYLDAYTDLVEAPEFVVDDVLAAGAVVVAGERGLGKTSALVPLIMSCTGLVEDPPLKATIRRKVVYIAEDTAQVQRIIAAMCADELITADRYAVNDWFRLVEAKRMTAAEIVNVVPSYDDLWTPNKKIDGSIYLAPPVVVMDTTNATIDLENISDNSHVSQAVAKLRQRFGAICLVMVGHVSKASRSDARQLSFIGAGAWEGDTQQTIYLVREDDQRYLVLGKRRFETDGTEYLINSHVSAFDAVNKLGHHVEIKCFYGVLKAISAEQKQEAKAERQAEHKAASWGAAQKRVKEYVKAHPGATTREISASVGGNATTTRNALSELVGAGEISVTEGARNAKHHRIQIGTQSDTVKECES